MKKIIIGFLLCGLSLSAYPDESATVRTTLNELTQIIKDPSAKPGDWTEQLKKLCSQRGYAGKRSALALFSEYFIFGMLRSIVQGQPYTASPLADQGVAYFKILSPEQYKELVEKHSLRDKDEAFYYLGRFECSLQLKFDEQEGVMKVKNIFPKEMRIFQGDETYRDIDEYFPDTSTMVLHAVPKANHSPYLDVAKRHLYDLQQICIDLIDEMNWRDLSALYRALNKLADSENPVRR